jgi:hypothetical protein
VAAALLSGCGGEAAQGTNMGPCYPDGTCNPGLVCVNGQCLSEGGKTDGGPRPDRGKLPDGSVAKDGPKQLDHGVKPDTVKPVSPWVATLKGPHPLMRASGMAARGDELILVGQSSASASAKTEMLVAKLTGKAKPGWQKRFSTGGVDYGGKVALAGAKDYLICGESNSKIWLVRIDGTGKVLWQRRYSDGAKQATSASRALPVSGGFLVAGSSYNWSEYTNKNLLVFKIDDNGNVQWGKRLQGPGGLSIRGATTLASGGAALVGTRDDGSDMNVFVVKLDATGGIVWKTEVGGKDWDLGGDVVEMPNKELVVLASTRSWGSGQNDLWFLRFGQGGGLISQQVQGGPGNDIGDRLFVVSGGLLVAGDTTSFGAKVVDLFAAKWSPAGNLAWQQRFGEAKWDYSAGAALVQGQALAIFADTDKGSNAFEWIVGVVDAGGKLPAGCPLAGGTTMNSGSTAAQIKQLQLNAVSTSVTYVNTNATATGVNMPVTMRCQ